MTALYEFLLGQVFGGFLREESGLLQEVDTFEGDLRVEGRALIFTLPALFKFTCLCYEKHHNIKVPCNRSDYLRFRNEIYNNPTNPRLRQDGGHVIVEAAHQEHDRSTYKLLHWLQEDAPNKG